MKTSKITALLLIFLPITTFGAVNYSRSPAGSTPTSPVTISVSFDNVADFGTPLLGATTWSVAVQGDNVGHEIDLQTTCLPVSTTSVSEALVAPLGGEVLAVRLMPDCDANPLDDYLFEGDDESVAFTISNATAGGVLFGSNSGNVYALVGSVSTSAFDDVLPWVIMIVGVLLGFYIVEMLIGTVTPKEKFNFSPSEYDKFRMSEVVKGKGDPITRTGQSRYLEK